MKPITEAVRPEVAPSAPLALRLVRRLAEFARDHAARSWWSCWRWR